MAADGQIIFEVIADGQPAERNIREITQTIQRESRNWENSAQQSTDSIGDSFSGMLKNIAGAFSAAKIGQMLLSIGKDAIDAASDLEEVQNVVDATFGDGAAKIQAWAQTAATQFGLTETQAKRFTSTLGAMMKSAGLSGDAIVEVSTDLSGLAADMASFYNLDFDEAFQKIRAGISGETEPLKQLGINMSTANLNAFALQKGLGKTFEQMSQGEQIMLRYQYLMQATADAQGDFARTSDGFANSVRKLQTQFETLKTQIGTALMPVVQEGISFLSEFMSLLTTPLDRTVLDDFNDIDIDSENKLAQIDATVERADALVSVLESCSTELQESKTAAGEILDDLPDGTTGNLPTLKANIDELGSKLEDSGTLAAAIDQKFTESGKLKEYTEKVQTLQSEFTTAGTDAGNVDKSIPQTNTNAEKYKGIISEVKQELENTGESAGAIDESIPGAGEKTNLSSYGDEAAQVGLTLDGVGTSAGKIDSKVTTASGSRLDEYKGIAIGTQGALEAAGEAAKGIDANIPTGDGSKIKAVKGEFDEIKTAAQEAATATGQITDAFAPAAEAAQEVDEETRLWLATCDELCDTIPGLSNIIDRETGVIRGGTDAVREYIGEWERTQRFHVHENAQSRKQAALDAKFADLGELELEADVAQYRVRKKREAIQAFYKEHGITFDPEDSSQWLLTGVERENYNLTQAEVDATNALVNEYYSLEKAAKSATSAFETQSAAYEEAKTAAEESNAVLEEERQELNASRAERGLWSMEAEEAAAAQVEAFRAATEAVADYYAEARKATRAQVDAQINGFTMYKTAAQQAEEAANEARQLEEELRATGKYSEQEIELRVNAENAQITLQNMQEGLESQLAYMQEYQRNLQIAREAGISEDILAQLADGSNESAMYLHAIAEAAEAGDTEGIQALNDTWQQVNQGKEQFTDSLTQTKLAVDETYQGLVTTAQEAAANLDVHETMAASTEANMTAIVDTIRTHTEGLSGAVDGVIAELDRLSGWGFNISLGSFGTFGASFGNAVDGSFAVGLDFVPFDGFLAQLHEGESILTAEEARIWRQFKDGQRGVDYDQLGGVMRDNINPGGDVYLDGATVGKVVSRMQGNSYRSLQRSGWQA